ncbi:MarR family winged helix-turn-helix transcriptional regulator [Fundidesulfovibrio agrisoli]|uniref:MarR family winged helix-turn-helix transcriptional regulator n=1 Tax=Fundidesulfovibrio agrisoli TaxID=2922717 RepID=UPI001FAB41A7|nr:MarR family transcriptional regulator [Fundidesulfovibrio agrisoli]
MVTSCRWRDEHRDPRHIGLTIYEVSRAWKARLDELFKPLGLSSATWTVIWALALNEEAMTQRELAQAVFVECSSLVRLLDRLEKDGWVRRVSDAADRRVKRVVLTEKAEPVLEEFGEVAHGFSDYVLDGIAQDRLETAHGVLMELKRKLDRNA